MFIATTATKKIARMKKRLRCIPGGTSAGKSISILLYLIARAQSDENPTLTSLVSESFPHLRRGILRDFQIIMKEHDYWREECWDKTNSTYTFETGSQFEFFSVDQGDKLRGARRDRLFINEANNTSFEAFEQLEVRTREFVILDWNPSSEFYYYTEIKTKRDDFEELTLTYKDNEALSPEIVRSIEQRRNRKGWWLVYGEGKLGEVEGRIYKDWATIEGVPHEAKLLRYGLDFGYTNDPTAIVAVYSWNGGYIVDEVCFQKGMSNRQIADVLLSCQKALVVADSSEPKSIDEIRSYGVSIVGAKKGRDSVRSGIQFVQDQRISVTKRSANVLNEYRNYLWETDRDGKVLNAPESGFDHACFTANVLMELPVGEVIARKSNGFKDVYEFMGSRVTADHPYLTQRGFVRLDALRYSDRIVVWKGKLWMEFHLGGTQTQRGPSLGTIFHLARRAFSAIRQNASIGIYGRGRTVRYLKVCTSTTKMAITLTTTYLTSSLYHLVSTLRGIREKGPELPLARQSKGHRDGQRLMKARDSDQNVVKKTRGSFPDTESAEGVTNAVSNTSQKPLLEDSATIIARLRHCGKEEVFSVATSSGFFTANGVVVSNCDAIRYALSVDQARSSSVVRWAPPPDDNPAV